MNRLDSVKINTISTLNSTRLLDRTFARYKFRYRHTVASYVSWSLSSKWDSGKQSLKHTIQQGTYQFQSLVVSDSNNNQCITCWQSIDGILLKGMTWVLTLLLKKQCDLSQAIF